MRYAFLIANAWLLARILEYLHTILDATAAHEKAAAARSAAASAPKAAAKARWKAGDTIAHVPASVKATHAWSPLDASRFRVRCGPNYPKNKRKAPSGSAMGEIFGVDLFFTKKKVKHILQYGHIELPPPTPGWDESYPEVRARPASRPAISRANRSHMVRAQLVVINQMLPRNFKNTPFIADDEDGESASFVIYIRFPPNLAKGWHPDDGEPVGAEQVRLPT